MAYCSEPGTTSPRRELHSRGVGGDADEPMLSLNWYHPHLSRHAADCMLIDNAAEGSYLLRPSTKKDGYVLSVKLSSSVQHIKVEVTGPNTYKFGSSVFTSLDTFRKHFEIEKPVIGSDSGVMVTLKYPYTRYVDERHLYTDVVHHAVTHMLEHSTSSGDSFLSDSYEESQEAKSLKKTLAISSKEGYLTKQGRIRKNWRVRWFVLRNQYLSYYKAKQSDRPIAVLNLLEAKSVDYDPSKGKNFCFRIVFPHRTYYMYANSNEDCDQWVELLHSKLNNS